MRRVMMALVLGLALLVVACGNDSSDESASDDSASTDDSGAADDSASTDDAGAADDSASTDDSASADDSASTDDAGAADDSASTDDSGAGDGAGVSVGLNEFELIAETSYSAGEISFAVDNNGDFPHQFSIVRGDSYETLPQTSNGAVDEDALDAGALIGATERIDSGASTELVVELEPGNYVFYCNIAIGANSHAARGQVLSVTVG